MMATIINLITLVVVATIISTGWGHSKGVRAGEGVGWGHGVGVEVGHNDGST